MLRIVQADSPPQVELARQLFREYADGLGFDLCFQSFQQELDGLPGEYAPPNGRLLLASKDDIAAGCVALHAFGIEGACEMKRLYVRPQFRGERIGAALANRAIEEARAIGYSRMLLDTVEPVMGRAVAMYRRIGFREIAAYRDNPIPGALYMELKLV
jgi:ribosomal protein S18 acetylase RimI-like enzyme